MDEGVMAGEERVITIVEGAATRKEEVVMADGTQLKGLGACPKELGTCPKELGVHPKESRGESKEKKEMVQVTQGRASLDELYPDYIASIPEDVRRRSKHFRQLKNHFYFSRRNPPLEVLFYLPTPNLHWRE
ncbi:hypothetical protein WISP_113958 [Willisornis vidua]|uniref:Uncharacterized protein n=1 Tax=Willisornis vidua TaxID=1566151 RepID=A0ABQ9CUK3_9PASS|nr:hypothetical protein WISP_113958 [Willisornis vidua]